MFFVCCLGDVLNPDWLSLLTEPRFHAALSGLFTRAIVLLQLLKECDNIRPLLDPMSLSTDLQDINERFVHNGVLFSQAFVDALNLTQQSLKEQGFFKSS